MTDGLGLLDEQRRRRSVRHIPTPRNPPRNTPVNVVAPTSQPQEGVGEQSAQEPGLRALEPVDKPPTRQAKPRARTADTSAPAGKDSAVQEPTIKMSIYLENSDDLYLENITHAGKTGRDRIAISRSAIVRLALQRLAATMSTDEIVNELRKSGSEHQGRGRKRR